MGKSAQQHIGAITVTAEELRQILRAQQTTQQTRFTEQPPTNLENLAQNLEEYSRWAARQSNAIDSTFGDTQQQVQSMIQSRARG